ncbi:MAG: dihydroneopterin aldolase [Bacteroidales bacterium]|nr:dihydroneopterin aldolase [Bacteroidales bacterium]
MAEIAINGMRFYAHHGCFEQERKIGTHFRVDLRLTADTSRAEVTDNIEDTVNYLSVYQTVKHEMEQPSHLLEHVARRGGEAVLRQNAAGENVAVKVYKLNPPLGGQMESVSVVVSLSR